MSYSNSEVAHMWAHQLKSSAEGSNFYFNGVSIYSYGSHFRCGVIVHNLQGDRAYILNENSYSATTSKHMCETRYAIPRSEFVMNTAYCEAPEIRNGIYCRYSSAIYVVLLKLVHVQELMMKYFKARSVDYRQDIFAAYLEICNWVNFWGMDKAQKWYKNEYDDQPVKMPAIDRFLTKRGAWKSIEELFYGYFWQSKRKQLSKEDVCQCLEVWKSLHHLFAGSSLTDVGEAVDEYFKLPSVLKRLKIEKKEAEKRNAARRELAAKMKAEQAVRDDKNIKHDIAMLATFHESQNGWHPSRAFEKKFGWHTALRIDYSKKRIVTSKGISLSYQEAQRLWKLVKAFHDGQQFHHDLAIDVNGSRWAFNSYEDDILTAGCHKIHFTECQRIAGLLAF